jgi:hypothetical protein
MVCSRPRSLARSFLYLQSEHPLHEAAFHNDPELLTHLIVTKEHQVDGQDEVITPDRTILSCCV